MPSERGVQAAQPVVRPAHAGLVGVLVLIVILRLVVLLGWRDRGSPIE